MRHVLCARVSSIAQGLCDKFEAFSEDMTRFYIAETVLALETMHALGYAHRDVRPDNIFVNARGHIALGDFVRLPVCAECIDRCMQNASCCGVARFLCGRSVDTFCMLCTNNHEVVVGKRAKVYSVEQKPGRSALRTTVLTLHFFSHRMCPSHPVALSPSVAFTHCVRINSQHV